jgi:hypothetical protein
MLSLSSHLRAQPQESCFGVASGSVQVHFAAVTPVAILAVNFLAHLGCLLSLCFTLCHTWQVQLAVVTPFDCVAVNILIII